MKRNIKIEGLHQVPLEQQEIELVERKCIGHPDSIADGIAESISRALCRVYFEECGAILHHNTDQGEIVAGESIPRYGGGKVIRPIYILIDGRATKHFDGINIPTDTTAVEAAREYLRENITNLNLERDVIIDCKLGTGSTDLRDVFRPCDLKIPRANDTSFGVGHAPFSDTENIVMESSRYIDTVLRPEYPAFGQDIKIMGLRDKDSITLTVACAIVDRYCSGLTQYVEYKEILKERLESLAKKYTSRKVCVHINTADDIDNGSVFLTVTGTSAEMGDDGSVGRGNRVQRPYHTQPPDEHGSNKREKPDQPYREDLQHPLHPAGTGMRGESGWYRGDIHPPALPDRHADRYAPRGKRPVPSKTRV